MKINQLRGMYGVKNMLTVIKVIIIVVATVGFLHNRDKAEIKLQLNEHNEVKTTVTATIEN
jgi:hypothetical protein|tara:strand:- start:4749 stop:4931 length:183 start_codon:yes stop_codon:yes gene_type:complete